MKAAEGTEADNHQTININDNDLREPEWDTLSGKPIDLQQLLRWGLQHSTRNEDSSSQPCDFAKNHEPIDPKWLEIIMGKSDVVRMKECMERIMDRYSLPSDDRIQAYDELELLVEDIDNAKDFIKLKLIDRLLDTLAWDEHEAEKDITSSLWILATIVQNNPQAKQAYLAMNLLPTLLRFSGSQHQSIALKAVYCLTGLLKNNSRAQADFHRLNGYDVVFRQLIDSSNPAALVCKVINMLSQLLVDNPQSIGRYIVRTYRNLVAVLMQIADRYPDDPNVQSLSTGLIRAVIDIDPTVEDYALNKAAIHKRFPEIYK